MKTSQSQPKMTSSTNIASSAAISITEADEVATSAITATSTLSSFANETIKTKIENTTQGLSSTCFNYLYYKVLPGPKGKENAITICNYVYSLKSEVFQYIISLRREPFAVPQIRAVDLTLAGTLREVLDVKIRKCRKNARYLYAYRSRSILIKCNIVITIIFHLRNTHLVS
jgi:hypothetical protein